MEFNKYEKYGAYHWVETEHKLSNSQFNPLLYARYKKLTDLIPLTAESILDAGCGDGYLLYLAYKRAPRAKLIGLECDSLGLKYASEKLAEKGVAVTLKQSSVYEIPYLSESFDVVLSADVIEHLDDYELALKEMHRILKPGGLLLMSTPLKRPNQKWDPLHVHEFTGKELLELCKRYFNKVNLTACWPKAWVDCWLQGGSKKRLFQIFACLGWNPALKESDPFTGDYQQLIIKCEK